MSVIKFGRPISTLHLELTGRCNLACPGCVRTTNPQGHEAALKRDLTWDKLTELVDPYELSQITHVYSCGNIGDPIASPHFTEIYGNLTSLNSAALHSIHTNGSLRTPSWWASLPKYLNNNHRVVFGLDGLEDTNHLYRKGAVWKKVMENTQAFIRAGGRAEWHFIVFEHNEHQVEEARQRATDLGFVKFSTLRSVRNEVQGLKYARNEAYVEPATEVVCGALEKQEIYVSADGVIFPCCYLGVDAFAQPKEKWQVNFMDVQALNNVPFNPTLSTCVKTCSRVRGMDVWKRQFEN